MVDHNCTLIFGFGPYLQYKANITAAIIETVEPSEGLVTEVFDVRFSRSMFLDTLKQHRPQTIIGLGQHPRARKLRLEKRATNQMQDPGKPARRIHQPGPEIRRVNLALPRNQHTTVTYNAGSYVCNYAMYICLEYCELHGAKFGFIHVPQNYDPEHVAMYLGEAIHFVR